MTAVSYSTFFIIVALMFGLTAIALLYIWVLAKEIKFVNSRIDKIRDHIHMQQYEAISNYLRAERRTEGENTNDSE